MEPIAESLSISSIKIYLKLTRFYLSLAIAFSTLAGFVFYNGELNWAGLFAFTGVFLLSAGASALNQYQERFIDVLMKRTRNRPLPSRQISPQKAVLVSIGLSVSGIAVLVLGTNWVTAALGAFNLLWYNAVYTPLKVKTRYVVIIGALTGALPPLMGWTAAGGSMADLEIIVVALFMFLWQVPHFYLLLTKFGKEYEAAGFPSITSKFSEHHVRVVIFIWILGTSASTLIFPFFNVLTSLPLIIGLVLMNVLLVYFFYRATFSSRAVFTMNPAFRSLYLFQVIVLVLLMVQSVAR